MPENTIPAFEYAIEAGVDVLELDLAVTKDDVLVVSHDPVINQALCIGSRGSVAIRELTLAQVQQYDCGSKKHPGFPNQKQAPGTKIPTLDEVLDWIEPTGMLLNVEIKRDLPARTALVLAVARTLRQRKEMRSRLIISSFDPFMLAPFNLLLPGVPLALALPGAQVTLLESSHKKAAFLQQVKSELKLDNATVVCERVERWSPGRTFEWVISRAFSELAEFVALAGRHAAPGGRLAGHRARRRACRHHQPACRLRHQHRRQAVVGA